MHGRCSAWYPYVFVMVLLAKFVVMMLQPFRVIWTLNSFHFLSLTMNHEIDSVLYPKRYWI